MYAYVCVCMYVCMRMHSWSQRTPFRSKFSPLIIWLLRTEPRSSGLAASAFEGPHTGILKVNPSSTAKPRHRMILHILWHGGRKILSLCFPFFCTPPPPSAGMPPPQHALYCLLNPYGSLGRSATAMPILHVGMSSHRKFNYPSHHRDDQLLGSTESLWW